MHHDDQSVQHYKCRERYDIPLIANLETIRNEKQHLVDENLRRQNSKRSHHTFRATTWTIHCCPNQHQWNGGNSESSKRTRDSIDPKDRTIQGIVMTLYIRY